jgi:insulysin
MPPHLLLAAPGLTWPWENEEDRRRGEEKVGEYLESFRVENSRVFLMAKKDDLVKLQADDLQWDKEPWYGTEYAVQRWDGDFLKEVRVVRERL